MTQRTLIKTNRWQVILASQTELILRLRAKQLQFPKGMASTPKGARFP